MSKHSAAVLNALAVCGPSQTVANVAAVLPDLNDGAIFVALRDLVSDGFVTKTSAVVKSADGKMREVGLYTRKGLQQ